MSIQESLIGRYVKMNFDFPLDEEVFEVIGERKNSVEIMGDFSAMNITVSSEWQPKSNIKITIKELVS